MNRMTKYLQSTTSVAPLALFRVLFGLLVVISMVRFWSKGWIEKLYIDPSFFFSYHGFEWVKPLGIWTYVIFGICTLAALGVLLGYRYRMASIVLFLSFTYIELMDKTTYLNHYYLVSLLSFMFIFLPAGHFFSLDSYFRKKQSRVAPKWCLDCIKLLISIVYLYAGLAKLNSEWLFEAMPLKLWLPAKSHVPIIGEWLQQAYVPYLFSWGGALYDLVIPFLLWGRKTKWLALVLVIGFHLMTSILFPIGMFPFVMIASATVFLDARWSERLVARFSTRMGAVVREDSKLLAGNGFLSWRPAFLGLFLVGQILWPIRHLSNQGEIFWHEQSYRFSWRVMLMDKTGYARFTVKDSATGATFEVDNSQFLHAFQEKQMSTQPDFILEYANYLHTYYKVLGVVSPAVYVDSYVSLNGRGSQSYVKSNLNLIEVDSKDAKEVYAILAPFEGRIKGF